MYKFFAICERIELIIIFIVRVVISVIAIVAIVAIVVGIGVIADFVDFSDVVKPDVVVDPAVCIIIVFPVLLLLDYAVIDADGILV